MARISRKETGLLIVEYDGTPRSGKGTSAENLIEKNPATKIVETGASYRAITFKLLEQGVIEPGMSEQIVVERLKDWKAEGILELAWEREAILRDHGKAALYDGNVPGLVGKVSPHKQVRDGVKKRFNKELGDLVEADDVTVAVCDGRNLAPVARKVKGSEIVQRVFFTCSDQEAANRELARYVAKQASLGKGVSDEEQTEYLNKKIEELGERRHDDEKRGLDPVTQEPNAIEYWHNPAIIESTKTAFTRQNMLSPRQANEAVTGKDHNKYSRVGAGAIAYSKGNGEARQIHYDTNGRPLNEMLDDTIGMFREALEARAQGLIG